MARGSHFLTYLLDSLNPLGSVRAKAMFGGYGIYLEGTMFAILMKDDLYLRVDEKSETEFQKLELRQFRGGPRQIAMPYYQAPPATLDDAVELRSWAEKAIKAANRVKK